MLLRAFDLGLGRRPLAPRRQVETLEVAEELPIANLRVAMASNLVAD